MIMLNYQVYFSPWQAYSKKKLETNNGIFMAKTLRTVVIFSSNLEIDFRYKREKNLKAFIFRKKVIKWTSCVKPEVIIMRN